MSNQAANSKSDIWIAIGVVLCLGIGASMTYWLTSAPHSSTPRRKALQGAPLNSIAGAAPGSPVSATPGSIAPANTNSEFLPLTFDLLGSYLYEIPNLQKPAAPIAAVKTDPARTLDKTPKPEEKVADAAATPKIPDQ